MRNVTWWWTELWNNFSSTQPGRLDHRFTNSQIPDRLFSVLSFQDNDRTRMSWGWDFRKYYFKVGSFPQTCDIVENWKCWFSIFLKARWQVWYKKSKIYCSNILQSIFCSNILAVIFFLIQIYLKSLICYISLMISLRILISF